jgi:hypothetical protein
MARLLDTRYLGDFIELVARNETKPSTLASRIVNNFLEFEARKNDCVSRDGTDKEHKGHQKDLFLYDVTNEEYEFLLQLFCEKQHTVLIGWIYSLRAIQRNMCRDRESANNSICQNKKTLQQEETDMTLVNMLETDKNTQNMKNHGELFITSNEQSIMEDKKQKEQNTENLHVEKSNSNLNTTNENKCNSTTKKDIYLDKDKLVYILDNKKHQLSDEQKTKFKHLIKRYLDEKGGLSISNVFRSLVKTVLLHQNQPLNERFTQFHRIVSSISHFLTILKICDPEYFLRIAKRSICRTLLFTRSLAKIELQTGMELDIANNYNYRFSWKDVMFAVEEVTKVALDTLKNGSVDVSFVESVIRMRLYVIDNPPRKNEYRTLQMHKPSNTLDEKSCNWFDSEHLKIILNVYDTLPQIYGTYTFKPTESTILLLNEIKSNDRKLVFTRQDRDEDDATPLTDLEWNQAIISDFQHPIIRELLGNPIITPQSLRYLYLTELDTIEQMELEPFFRFDTIKAMGHTLQEHVTICAHDA